MNYFKNYSFYLKLKTSEITSQALIINNFFLFLKKHRIELKFINLFYSMVLFKYYNFTNNSFLKLLYNANFKVD